MKKVLAGALLALTSVLIYKSCTERKEENNILEENSMLIQQELQNVSKLMVSEGHFSEVYSYKDSKELFGPMLTADKKALVVVNAAVSISYDMRQLTYEIDTETKTVRVNHLPEPEISINPDFEYYDVTADYLNPFEAKDYNTIKDNVKKSLLKKIEASTLVSNAENRFLSELSRILLLTETMGWTLEYQGNSVSESQVFLD
ncbi:MAG: DUF4230 domain-containing protein [Bacteroidota bacterium]